MVVDLITTCAARRTNFIKIQKAMIRSGQDILTRIHKKWQLRFLLEIALYALGLAVLVYGLSSNLLFSVLGFTGVFLVLSLVWKPWKYDMAHVCQYLDAKLPDLEYSTSLLLQEEDEMTLLARLQREKIGQQILESTAQMSPERSLKKALITFMVLVLGAWLISYFGLAEVFKSNHQDIPEQGIIFSAVDSTQQIADQPLLLKQSVRVRYPNYTRKAVKSTTEMNLKVLQGSVITWSLEFDKEVAAVRLQL